MCWDFPRKPESSPPVGLASWSGYPLCSSSYLHIRKKRKKCIYFILPVIEHWEASAFPLTTTVNIYCIYNVENIGCHLKNKKKTTNRFDRDLMCSDRFVVCIWWDVFKEKETLDNKKKKFTLLRFTHCAVYYIQRVVEQTLVVCMYFSKWLLYFLFVFRRIFLKIYLNYYNPPPLFLWNSSYFRTTCAQCIFNSVDRRYIPFMMN